MIEEQSEVLEKYLLDRLQRSIKKRRGVALKDNIGIRVGCNATEVNELGTRLKLFGKLRKDKDYRTQLERVVPYFPGMAKHKGGSVTWDEFLILHAEAKAVWPRRKWLTVDELMAYKWPKRTK